MADFNFDDEDKQPQHFDFDAEESPKPGTLSKQQEPYGTGKFQSNTLAFDPSYAPLFTAKSAAETGYNDVNRATHMVLGNNAVSDVVGPTLGVIGGGAMAANTALNPIGKVMSLGRNTQALSEALAGEEGNALNTIRGLREVRPDIQPRAEDTGHPALDTALNFADEVGNQIIKAPELLMGAKPGKAKSIVENKVAKDAFVKAPHVTSTTIGDMALKGEKSMPVHEALSSQDAITLNKHVKARNGKDMEMSRMAYAEAIRNNPMAKTAEEVQESADSVADRISGIYNMVKQNPKPVDRSSVVEAIQNASKKKTMDEGQVDFTNKLLAKYKSGNMIDLETAIADENNANAHYKQMVLNKGKGSHEAQIAMAERDALSKIVDKGFEDSGVPNAKNLGRIYRGSKMLSQGITDSQLKASLRVADKTKVTPTAAFAAMYGVKNLVKGAVTQNWSQALEGGAEVGAALKSIIRREKNIDARNPDFDFNQLHKNFTSKVRVGNDLGPAQRPKYSPPPLPASFPALDPFHPEMGVISNNP